MKRKIPRPTLERFPKYYHVTISFLNKYKETHISSVYLANCLNMDDSQVRRDMMYLEIDGKPRVGYNAIELKNTLAHYLGYFNVNEALLVGVGNLGTAIAQYGGFADYGLEIVGLFDNQAAIIGTKVNNITVLETQKLEKFIKKEIFA